MHKTVHHPAADGIKGKVITLALIPSAVGEAYIGVIYSYKDNLACISFINIHQCMDPSDMAKGESYMYTLHVHGTHRCMLDGG